MANKRNGDPAESGNSGARLVTSPEDKVKAKKWFARALELGEKRQFDYAIEYYVNGLEYWPDAVEEACKALHGCAVARRQTGGKKPGLKDTMRRSMTDKNAKRALLNAAWLFGHDPDNVNYIEGLARNASRLRAEDTAAWASGVCLKAFETAPKTNPKQFQLLAELLEELGDRAADRSEVTFGVDVYQMGVDAINMWWRRTPTDRNLERRLKDLSTKLTILRGKYKDGESFRDSIADKEAQKDLHDEHRSVQADERVDELIAKAVQEHEQNPDDGRRVKALVDLLCRRERETDELRAIGVLVKDFKRTGEYSRKQVADDIRMKQLSRKTRDATKAGDQEAMKQHQVASLRFELGVFKERTERYPTDNRVKFEYAVRLFRAGKFDDAIPLFQGARADPKNRTACGMYLGRCFFRKEYFSQAISTLKEEIAAYPFNDDNLVKTMLYWLARAHEAAGDMGLARETYGKILQVDYNFRDVRARLDSLPESG